MRGGESGEGSGEGEPWGVRLARLVWVARPGLLAFVRRRFPAALRGRLDPEDIVQDTLILAIQKLADGARSDVEVQRWLAATARHRLWRALRQMAQRSALWTPLDGDEPIAAPARDAPQAQEDVRQLARALAALPGRARRVLWMRRLEGRSWAKIVAILGLPSIGAAQQLERRARGELARRLGLDAGPSLRSRPDDANPAGGPTHQRP